MRKFLVSFVFTGLALVSLTGCEKYALDRQMEELCKKDGGVNIFEHVKLPENRFDSNGRIKEYREPNAGYPDFGFSKIYGPEYHLEWLKSNIKKGDPVRGQGNLDRNEFRLTRISDGKTLAVSVGYSRTGGDFIYIGHYSSKRCPDIGRDTSVESVFVKED